MVGRIPRIDSSDFLHDTNVGSTGVRKTINLERLTGAQLPRKMEEMYGNENGSLLMVNKNLETVVQQPQGTKCCQLFGCFCKQCVLNASR